MMLGPRAAGRCRSTQSRGRYEPFADPATTTRYWGAWTLPTRFNSLDCLRCAYSLTMWWTASHRRGVPCWADSRTDAGRVKGLAFVENVLGLPEGGGVQAAGLGKLLEIVGEIG